MKLGFIGLGRMGQGMARNLSKSGVDLLLFDINPAVIANFRQDGVKSANSVAELARRCDVVFTSLPGPAEVREVALGHDGVVANFEAGKTLFDLSTNSLSLVREIEIKCRQRGAFMLDAPVSGGPAGAASGDLVVWAGGDRATYEKHVDVLKLFAKVPRYVGSIGAGTVTKLAHNMLGYMLLLAQAEVFSLAKKAGVDALDLWEAFRFGVVGKQSPLDMLVNQFLPGKYDTPAFALKLAHKDVSLATSLARELGVPMRLANMTMEEMTEALGRGFGDWDSRAYLQLQLERAGVKIAIEPARLQAALERTAKPRT